jgi:hypothetical protein
MDHLDRTLYAAARSCQYGCVYCFAKFDQFAANHSLPSLSDDQVREDDIIYPTCDGEFFSDRRAVSKVEDLVNSTRNSVRVSISVKSRITAKQAQFLHLMNGRLAAAGRGLIKCSISLCTKHQVKKYEPRTPSYLHRLDALKSLADKQVPTSVNLKPILPCVPEEEYEEMIADTAPYTTVYLLGGLYIDSTTEFGNEIRSKYSSLITIRPVDWLPNRPNWEYCENPQQLESVRRSIIANGAQVFDTDLLVMDYLFSQPSSRGQAVQDDDVGVSQSLL